MSLRTRLVLAFFALSVVPLAAVTFYSYNSNAEALRIAAEREADLLAGELGQRMQLVTAQLSERVEHLMDIAELQAAADAASAQTEPTQTASSGAATTKPAPVTVVSANAAPGSAVFISQTALSDSIARSLGETAMLLNNVRMQNMRGGGGGGRGGGRGGPPPGVVPPPPPVTTVGRAIPTSPAPATPPRPTPGAAMTPTPAATPAATVTPAGTPPPDTGQFQRGRGPRPGGGGGGGGGNPNRGFDPQRSRGGDAGNMPPPPGAPPATGAPAASTMTLVTDQNGNLTIDMGPLRRELLQQVLPQGKRLEDLSTEERQKLMSEVNQRLLGVQLGLQISAAEVQKRAQEAEREAAAKEAAAATAAAASKSKSTSKSTSTSKSDAKAPAAPASVPATDLKRRSSLTGNSIAVNVERNGEVVRTMNAEINLPNVLGLVFSTSQKDRGELPFAIAKDGTIYARSDADKTRVKDFGAVAKPDGPTIVRLPAWIVVTTEDKSGSGLRLGVARPVGDSLANLRKTAARNAGLGLLFIAVALVGIVPLSSRLTRNLSTLSDGVSRIAHGDYSARVPVRSNDEVGQLAKAFNQMAGDVERHQHTAVEQERIRRELELGRQIQAEMLPHAPLNLGLTQVQGVSVPAREVGGDFFNYFVLDNGHLALLMGDVSGKGVGAALLMANIQASLKIRLGLGQSLAAVADALDLDIESNSPGPVYATLFIGVMEPLTRRLRYVNAGHNPQYVLRANGGLERMHATGLPVGLLAGRGYREESIQLAQRDLLVFYTDGCVEVENEQGEEFGVGRLETLLLSSVASADPLHRIETAIATFRGTSEPLDDATLMTVKVG
jgi:serine phosphatase RsbU (regulator of sigma subunit)